MGDHDESELPPLACAASSFVSDPRISDAVDVERAPPELHASTEGPNRYTIHVPTEVTRLSLGEASPVGRWNTDVGVTGYSDSHIHFETTSSDKTVVSLGGPATTAGIRGLLGDVPASTSGYSMVTERNAWHDAKLQHYLLSQTEDVSVRTAGTAKRSVVQADGGKVDLHAGKQVSISGGGVSIAAGELEIERVGYGEAWEGRRAHASGAAVSQVITAITAALLALGDLYANKSRAKYAEGELAATPTTWKDIPKWIGNGIAFGGAMAKVCSLVSAPEAPPECVKISADETVAAAAGDSISIFGLLSASLGAAEYATVSAGVAASLKAMAFGGVAGTFASMKGYRKVEMGSDYGDVRVGAETDITLEAEHESFTAGAKVSHVASPEGMAVFGGKKVWLGTPAGAAWGLLFDEEGFAMGQADNAKALSDVKVRKSRALRITSSSIAIKSGHAFMQLDGDGCTFGAAELKSVTFDADDGPITLNGQRILLR